MEKRKDAYLGRIDEVLEYYGSNRTQLARKMGMAQSTLSDMFARGSDPKRVLLRRVCEAYPDVRRQWLEEGVPPMLRSQDMSAGLASVAASIDALRETVALQQQTIERLCAMVEAMGKGK